MNDSQSSTSLSLIKGIRAGRPDAWERMVKLYSPLVYSWCRRSELAAEDASDALQEILRAAWTGIEGFRRDRPDDTFRGWLRTVARSKVSDFYQQRRKQPQAAGGSTIRAQMENLAVFDEAADENSPETADLYRRALDLVGLEFEEKTQQAFWLTTMEDQPAKDVAVQLGMTPGAVRQARYKVLRRLREALGDKD